MEQCKPIILSRHCLHRTKHCVSVCKSKGRQGKNSYQSRLLWATSSTPPSRETLLAISDTHTHCAPFTCSLSEPLSPVILNSKNTQWWNIDFLSSFFSGFSWMPGKDSRLKRSVLDPGLCSLERKHIVSLYFHLR